MESGQLVAGDIVRYQKHFLALVVNAWSSSLAPVSGRLVSLEYLGDHQHWAFGRHMGVIDASDVEFFARGVPPDAPVEELGMGHPWIVARMQAGIDAGFSLRCGTSLQDALQAAQERASGLFGDVPAGWIEMAVARVYASNAGGWHAEAVQ